MGYKSHEPKGTPTPSLLLREFKEMEGVEFLGGSTYLKMNVFPEYQMFSNFTSGNVGSNIRLSICSSCGQSYGGANSHMVNLMVGPTLIWSILWSSYGQSNGRSISKIKFLVDGSVRKPKSKPKPKPAGSVLGWAYLNWIRPAFQPAISPSLGHTCWPKTVAHTGTMTFLIWTGL